MHEDNLKNQPKFSELDEICEERQSEIQVLQEKIRELEKVVKFFNVINQN